MDATPRLEPPAPGTAIWRAAGDWRIGPVSTALPALACLAVVPADPRTAARDTQIDARAIAGLDSAGALVLLQLAGQAGVAPAAIHLAPEHRALLTMIHTAQAAPNQPPSPEPGMLRRLLAQIGMASVEAISDIHQLLGFFGATLVRLASALVRPARIPFTSVVHHMEQTGLDALPLVALLSFLVGAVIAFLGATVLRDFGAELFVIDLTSYAFLREFGVMLTAILLAGRTASAFTAQIGTMKSREEIDAMRTLGLEPIDLLVIPRLLALLLMLPLLSIAATLAGIGGGMLVAWLSLDIVPSLFLNHLHETIEIRHYLVGVGKAPLFALVVALVGCLEGFKVTGTAQSVGERTTSAVVQAITLVILIDAFAAIYFMEMGW